MQDKLKYAVAVIYIISAILFGCSNKRDIKPDLPDTLKQDVKSDRGNIEEELNGYDYNTVIDKYNSILPEGFILIRFRYFVIFSDLDEKLTYSLVENDIRNTIECMKNNYTKSIPDKVTPIIIFNDYEKYKKFVLENYDIPEHDISPYGFYKISKNVIIIRYVSWKGSLMHEVTHRFLRSDFPNIPSWFDEGFAALHEKSSFKNGVLKGEFSWRIISIRRALDDDKYTGLKTLMESNDDELYGKRSSFYYAQARYLLMYIQEKGLLKDYYNLFKTNFHKDESGITQLEKVLKKPLEEIDGEFLKYLETFK